MLSALLVESYQALQPDPSAIMIALLSQVVAQTHTYTFSAGYLNSTVAPLDVASLQNFTPTLAAKRVNVIWFASLTLSLISASFGILVKQWLREYLSGDYVSPQARLRIRQFRAPGLDDWRVFTIAALLPLVLQLALALFFVGLCFFTLDVHQSIGYTTIPLVAGWALLFLTASFASALSPRCPYKIPFFKYAMQLLRTSLFNIILLLKGMPFLPEKCDWPVMRSWTWWSLGYSEEDAAQDERYDVDSFVAIDGEQKDDQLVMKMCSALIEMHAAPESMVTFVLEVIHSRLKIDFKERPLPLMLDLSQLPVQTCTILMDAIADVLSREVKKFPVAERIQWTNLTRDCVSLLLARLPCLLSDKAMSVMARCFAGTQTDRTEETFRMIFGSTERHDRHQLCLHLQECLQRAFLHLNAWQFVDTMFEMLSQSCCTCRQTDPPAASGLQVVALPEITDRDEHGQQSAAHDECGLIEHVMTRHRDSIPSVLQDHTWDVMIGFMLHQVNIGAKWNEWHRRVLIVILEKWTSGEEVPWGGALKELVRHLLTDAKFIPHFYRHLFHRNDYLGAAVATFNDTFPSTPGMCICSETGLVFLTPVDGDMFAEKELIILSMCNEFTAYLEEMAKTPDMLDNLFYLTLLWFINGQFEAITCIVDISGRLHTAVCYLPLYRAMWKSMHAVQSRFKPAIVTTHQTRFAKLCLQKIDKLDALWLSPGKNDTDATEDFEEWAESFDPAMSFFEDYVIEDLMEFLPDPEEDGFKRVRRVFWMQTKAEEAYERTGGSDSEDLKAHISQADGKAATTFDEPEHRDATGKDEVEAGVPVLSTSSDDSHIETAKIPNIDNSNTVVTLAPDYPTDDGSLSIDRTVPPSPNIERPPAVHVQADRSDQTQYV